MKVFAEATLGNTVDNSKRAGFIKYDRKVLRFQAVWDDRESLYGDLQRFEVKYAYIEPMSSSGFLWIFILWPCVNWKWISKCTARNQFLSQSINQPIEAGMEFSYFESPLIWILRSEMFTSTLYIALLREKRVPRYFSSFASHIYSGVVGT